MYGLHAARAAVAKDDWAVVVEGYTDVLALHQAGLAVAVASMGTALTEAQLKELRRLTGRLYLCFDADAAGEAATLRGMDLAYKEFDEVLVVPLPPGTDPAEVAGDFEDRLAAAVSYPRYRVKLEIDRSRSDAEAFTSIREIMSGFDANTEWMDAIRYAADRLDLPHNLQAMLAPTTTRKVGQVTRRVLEAGERLERDALAGVLAHPDLVGVLREVAGSLRRRSSPSPTRRPRGGRGRGLGAHGPSRRAGRARRSRGIDEPTAQELLLRLRERHLRRELAGAEGERVKELQAELERLRAAASTLA